MNFNNVKRNRTSILILTIGIPGSGKSTWVKQYMRTHPLTYVVSTDDLRKELTGVEQCVNPNQNTMIHDEARKRVESILKDPNSRGGLGPEIIVDSTNVDCEEWLKYKRLGATIMIAKLFDVTPQQAMKNQLTRDRQVPLHIVQDKWYTLKQNKRYMPLYFNMIDIVVFTPPFPTSEI